MAVTINGTTGILAPDIGIDGTTLTVDAVNNRVGIATSSPATALDIQSTKNSDGLTVTKGSNVSAFLGHNGSGDEGLLLLKEGGTTKVLIYAETNQNSYFNSGGSVGIGTNNPTGKLEVVHASQTDLLKLKRTSGNDGVFTISLGGAVPGTIFSTSGVCDDFVFNAGSERLRITSDGKVRVPDGGKFTAGAGDDLQLYHDGTDSFIHGTTTTRQLKIRGQEVRVVNEANSEIQATFVENGAVSLYYDNVKKFETTSTGVSVSGTRSANNVSDAIIKLNITNSNGDSKKAEIKAIKTADVSSEIIFSTTATHTFAERMRIADDGKVGIGGLTSPGALLHLRDSNNATQGAAQLKVSKGVGSGAAPASTSRANCYIHLGGSEWGSSGTGQYIMGLGYTNGETGTGIPAYIGFKETSASGYTVGDLIFGTRNVNTDTAATERLRIDSSGRLLKSGQASLTSTTLSYPIQVAAASDANAIAIFGRASDDIGELAFYEADKSTKLGELQYRQDHLNFRHRVGDIRFATGGVTERLRITSGGYVNIGGNLSQTDYTAQVTRIGGNTDVMQIKGNTGNSFIRFTDSDATSDFTLGSDDGAGAGAGSFILYDRNASAYRMFVSAAGRVGVNDSTTGWAENFQVTANTSHNQYGIAIKIQSNSGYLMRFATGNAAPCGSISGGSGNSTSFNTSWSDSRRKKNFETWNEEVLPYFKSLEPKKFNFTQEDDGTVKTKGYVAQDNVDKFPEAYPSLDDSEVDEKRYMFNPSGMVIYLMKALQEEIAKREALESRIAALES